MPERADIDRYLRALFTDAPSGSLVEVRWRAGAGMGRDFFHADTDLDGVAAAILWHARRTDVYVGVLPRRRPGGGRGDLVETSAVLWADCDSASAVSAPADFRPHPSIIVASGTAQHRHAYWLLSHPVSFVEIEAGNRQLARALGADIACSEVARILRPPSWSHKTSPPSPVELLHCDPDARHRIKEIVGDASSPPPHHERWPRVHDDPLLDVPPAVYVEALTGVPVPRHRKIPCPLHPDDTPSLHVYEEPARGWYCYGCRRGGTVYDLAAGLFGLSTRGSDFRLLQQRLDAELSPLVDLTVPDR